MKYETPDHTYFTNSLPGFQSKDLWYGLFPTRRKCLKFALCNVFAKRYNLLK